ncbi:GerAB/ArcD/ProY family transporter [Propionispora vibrioides]|uniref:Spore germination protein KB n=1 Tax=Propionispora vibrioides TaxID=112903 RepID=A0A1H8XW64_9FIRM|nr:GerAB/ArcD/ProY family transporter [Propionispora vibrioides]SEP44001.1 spore germination protein KB [Propionispora vibrioides]
MKQYMLNWQFLPERRGKRMIQISTWQLYCLMMLFEIGSTTVFGLGIDANEDAWLAILTAMFFGFLLLWIFTEIHRRYPDRNLVEIIQQTFGNWLAIPLAMLYGLEFFWIATLNFREFGELISMILLPNIPLSMILIIFMITVVYVLFLGCEVLARMGEIMFPIVVFFIIATIFLISASGEVSLHRLQPVLGSGVGPVLKAAIPAVLNFPFGEMVVFFMYWPFAREKKLVRKTSMFVTATIGVLLSSVLALMVAVLGVPLVKISTIPIYEVIKLINIMDIITNLDSIATVVMFIGGFFKMAIHFYGGILVYKTLLKVPRKHEKWLIVFFGAFWTWFSITYYPNLIFHRWAGLKVSISYFYSGFTVFELVCPVLLLIAIYLKDLQRRIKKTDNCQQEGS